MRESAPICRYIHVGAHASDQGGFHTEPTRFGACNPGMEALQPWFKRGRKSVELLAVSGSRSLLPPPRDRAASNSGRLPGTPNPAVAWTAVGSISAAAPCGSDTAGRFPLLSVGIIPTPAFPGLIFPVWPSRPFRRRCKSKSGRDRSLWRRAAWRASQECVRPSQRTGGRLRRCHL